MPNAIGMRANARTSMTAKPIRDSAMDQVPADGHGGRRARRARQSRTAAVVPAIAAIRVATGAIGMLRNGRSEEHTSELQSLMRNSYAVFCLKKKKNNNHTNRYIIE